ncbi:hypothetical protein VTK73DRAFT_7244 [Phialemonium thermophilum]|uniref:C3H1-type domain-containing protein n=1 Tax=Phialemonium thermophilum TaxID=223376 RepID=A0ABR3XTW8_9PEZI
MRSRNRGAAAQTPPMHYQKPDAASAGKKKKRKTNTLGLTPGEESEEDDENEEEKLTELIGADAPNPADIAAWIEERRRNYPTKARVEAKLRAAAKAQTGETKKSNEDRDAELEKQQQKAEKLRKQLEKVESRIKRKREQQDEGDEMRDVDESSSSLDSSDDEKPETMSTRQEYHLPAPPKKADPTKHCKYYSTGGTCGKKGKCRFVHDPAVREAALREREMNGGRMTLQQRLILNDKEQEDLTIVQTLKYLQDKGLLQAKDTPTPSNAQSSTSQSSVPATVSKEQNHGLPAIPPPSVVPSTSTAKYIGWNLSGFGNTGVKSDG